MGTDIEKQYVTTLKFGSSIENRSGPLKFNSSFRNRSGKIRSRATETNFTMSEFFSDTIHRAETETTFGSTPAINQKQTDDTIKIPTVYESDMAIPVHIGDLEQGDLRQ
jgi:hypothetical protein